MRIATLFVLSLCLTFGISDAYAAKRAGGLSSVCSSSEPVSGFLIKAEASNHINNGDPRTSGYSLICGRECAEFIAQVYYCDGTPAASFGYYGKWSRSHGGNGRPRAYGAAGGAPKHSVRLIRAVARRKPCGNNLYVQLTKQALGGKAPACRHWDANSSRSGSTAL